MIKIPEIALPLDATNSDIIKAAAKQIKVSSNDIKNWRILRRSVDARKKNDVKFVYTVLADVGNAENAVMKKNRNAKITSYNEEIYVVPEIKKPEKRPVVIGFGPGGMLAALVLAQAGACPIVFERGGSVEERSAAITLFRKGGAFSDISNVQFGEGGAGTFSDGKLNTGINDARIKKVFEEFVKAGAPDEILYEAKPHIGTDLLPKIVKNIREEIISLGGEIHFGEKLTGIITKEGKLSEIEITPNGKNKYTLECDNLILAIGHSARDTFRMLYDSGFEMTQKNFSVGARIEHKQELINKSQYGSFYNHKALGAADYKLNVHLENGRGVYTFCMCPGGTVVCASSEEGGVVTNGMSEFLRDKENANSAVLVGVSREDFESDHPLAGIEFQRKLEKAAFNAGGKNYSAPTQRFEDFLKGKASKSFGDVKPSYEPGTAFCDISSLLPNEVSESLKEGIKRMDNRLRGFASPDALLTGLETRSSSPVRILRDENFESVNVKGVYPCAEGAGYAGGITSAAVDGIRCAEKIIDKLKR